MAEVIPHLLYPVAAKHAGIAGEYFPIYGMPSNVIQSCAAQAYASDEFHPLKFLAGIAKDLNIYEHTFVKELSEHEAVTANGAAQAYASDASG